VILALIAAAGAGPWVHDPGRFYARAGYDRFQATQSFDEQGERAPNDDERFLQRLDGVFSKGTYTGQTLSAYAELGIAPHLEVFGSLPYALAQNRWTWAQGDEPDVVQDNAGFGDALGGLRAGLTKGPYAASLSASVRGPLYDNAPELLGTETGNTDFTDDKVPLGQGTIDVDALAAGGVSLPFPGWASLETGVRLRDRGYATGLPGAVQVGWKPAGRIATWANASWLWTFGGGDQPDFHYDDYGKGPTIIDGQRWLKAGVGGMFDVWHHLALEVGAGDVVLGRNTAAGWSVGAGVSYRTPWEAP
jgi:hypothetical protein